MVEQILTAAGFVENKTYKETRFLKAPKSSYAVYLDTFVRRGADNRNFIKEHSYTIELYSYSPDPRAELNIENAFDSFGIAYDKQERYWIQEEQLYQVIYTFEYFEK